MATTVTEQPIEYLYVAAAAQTVFAVLCRIFVGYEDAFVVTVNDIACAFNAAPTTNRQFSVTALAGEGGSLTFGAGLTAGDRVHITRKLPIENIAFLPETGPLAISDLNEALSRIVALVQDRAAVPIDYVHNVTDTTYSLGLEDINVRSKSASPTVFVIPSRASVPFPAGKRFQFEQGGAGMLTISPGPGVTLNARLSDYSLAGQYAVAGAYMVEPDVWTLFGDL